MTKLSVSLLQLSHFRSHRQAAFQFDGRPVAIFGQNGAGKTNILEALSLLSPGRGLRRETPEELAARINALEESGTAGEDSHAWRDRAHESLKMLQRLVGKIATLSPSGEPSSSSSH